MDCSLLIAIAGVLVVAVLVLMILLFRSNQHVHDLEYELSLLRKAKALDERELARLGRR